MSRDIAARIAEFRALKRGWFEDGRAPCGEPFEPAGLDWVEGLLLGAVALGAELPHIYPSPEGEISAEWGHTDVLFDVARRAVMVVSERLSEDGELAGADVTAEAIAGWVMR